MYYKAGVILKKGRLHGSALLVANVATWFCTLGNVATYI